MYLFLWNMFFQSIMRFALCHHIFLSRWIFHSCWFFLSVLFFCGSICYHSGKHFPFPSYLVLYMWKQSVKQKGKDMFSEMLSILSMKQQQNDNKHPDAQGTKKLFIWFIKSHEYRWTSRVGRGWYTTASGVASVSRTKKNWRYTSWLCTMIKNLFRFTSRAVASLSLSASNVVRALAQSTPSWSIRGPVIHLIVSSVIQPSNPRRI